MKTIEISKYEQSALDFLNLTKTEFSAKYLKYDKHFDTDKEKRDIYEITIKRGGRSYIFQFGQSLNCTGEYIAKRHSKIYLENTVGQIAFTEKEYRRLGSFYRMEVEKNPNYRAPTTYDVLACLTKYDPGTFENFCGEYGYDTDSRSAEKTYNAVVNEWQNIAMLFNDNELEQLIEIQ